MTIFFFRIRDFSEFAIFFRIRDFFLHLGPAQCGAALRRLPFGPLLRRHHCRQCGLIYCWRCTHRGVWLARHAGEPALRTCYPCKVRLDPANQVWGRRLASFSVLEVPCVACTASCPLVVRCPPCGSDLGGFLGVCAKCIAPRRISYPSISLCWEIRFYLFDKAAQIWW